MSRPPSDTPPGSAPASRVPRLRPAPRRQQWRVTALFAAAVAVLLVLRLFSSHPLPRPSHATPAAAVAGYVQGLREHNPQTIARYLLPSRRGQARSLLQSLARRHTLLANPDELQVIETGSRAEVTLQLQVCYRNPGQPHYTCTPLTKLPLGLPDVIQCRRRGGSWYAETLFRPL